MGFILLNLPIAYLWGRGLGMGTQFGLKCGIFLFLLKFNVFLELMREYSSYHMKSCLKRVVVNTACAFCENAGESAEHLFFQCDYAVSVWGAYGRHWGTMTGGVLGWVNECARKFSPIEFSHFVVVCWVFGKQEIRKSGIDCGVVLGMLFDFHWYISGTGGG